MKDADRVADAGSGFRVVIGEYGSGKTFFSTWYAPSRWRRSSSPCTQT
jgi:KaiC/GvpD/RAD55 family RecA-like ATPase